MRHLHWTSWRSGAAYGHGQAFGYFASEYHVTTYAAHTHLYDVKTHHGVPYFSKMEISAHGHKTMWVSMSQGMW
jgi:hypothetical protein